MSIRYRKVSGGMYNDAKVLTLSKDAFFLWKSFLAGPCTTNIPGVLIGSKTVFLEATEKWISEPEFDAGLAEIVGQKMAIADFQCRLMYLPNALKHQGERPNINQIKAWCNTWRDMRNCPLKWHIYHRLLRFIRQMDATSKSPLKHSYQLAFSEACEAPEFARNENYTDPFESLYPCGFQDSRNPTAKVSRTQEQEQEQEQEETSASAGFSCEPKISGIAGVIEGGKS